MNTHGHTTSELQHFRFNTFAFEGNPKLCGAPPLIECIEIYADSKNNVNPNADNESDELPLFFYLCSPRFHCRIVGLLDLGEFMVL